jgi:hypothetical protein
VLDLGHLREKRRKRLAARKHHKALWRRTHKRGFALAAARDGRAMRRLRKLIAEARRLADHTRGTLAAVRVHSTALGPPHWGGGADVMGQFVTPFMRTQGLAPGSGKRTPEHNAAIGGSPTSDHLTTRTECFARDYPTFNGLAAAHRLAMAFGIDSWQANSYTAHDVEIDGHTFRVQILWGAAIEHGDHVHVGIEIVG